MNENELPPLRVLVVDDSALFRQSISSVLRDIPGVEIVGTARDGVDAIAKIQTLAPDLITLDVEMPNMNGIETLRQMNRLRIKTRAIMVSSLTEAGAKVTLDALFEGAFDFIQKPTGGMTQARDGLKEALTAKLAAFEVFRRTNRLKKNDALALAKVSSAATTNVAGLGLSREKLRSREGILSQKSNASESACELVVIGLSTGGPQMLRHVVPKFEADFPVPIVIVQHMPAKYTETMANRLDELSKIRVVEAGDAMRLTAAAIYIAPGGRHLKIVGGKGTPMFRLTDDPPENSCRPSVDYTMRSAADVYRGGVLAVIMTGMGRDGTAGCQAIVSAGGNVFSQDEATSAVYGMPKAVADAGLVQRVLPLGKITPAITRHVVQSRSARSH